MATTPQNSDWLGELWEIIRDSIDDRWSDAIGLRPVEHSEDLESIERRYFQQARLEIPRSYPVFTDNVIDAYIQLQGEKILRTHLSGGGKHFLEIDPVLCVHYTFSILKDTDTYLLGLPAVGFIYEPDEFLLNDRYKY